MAYVLIDPQSVWDFTHDWSDFLAENDVIVSRQWTISPLNNTSPQSPTLVGSTGDVVFVSGCMAGRIYHLREHILTSAGIQDDRIIVLRCEDQ